MDKPEASAGNPLAAVLPRLMGFADLAASLAKRFKGAARFLALTGMLAAVWLAYRGAHSFGFAPATAALAGMAMALPGLVLGWVWFVLGQASELPQRLSDWLDRAHAYAGDTWPGLRDGKPGRGRIGDLKALAGLAYELRSMGGDARELMVTLGGVMSLTSPLFLLLVAASALAIVLLDIVAMISGLVYLLG
jgi:hypothetical protein